MRSPSATALLVLSGLALAACVAPRPDGLIPADFLALRETMVQQFPDAERFTVLNAEGRGLTLGLDGTASFTSPGNPIAARVQSTVSGFDGNTVCLSEAGNWPGLCMSVYENPTGGYYCEGQYGDGRGVEYVCAIRPEGSG